MTKFGSLLQTTWVALALVVLVSAGCRPKSTADAGGSAANLRQAQVTPGASFEEIARQFAEAIETGAGGVSGGYISHSDGGHSRLTITNEVSHELIPPEGEDDTYRGIITVSSHYDYSLLRTAEEEKADEDRKRADEEKPTKSANSLEQRWTDGDGVEAIDQDLVTAPSSEERKASPSKDDIIARRSEDDVRHYELVYEGGKWVLKTKLDPNTERAVENAFNHILAAQP